MPAEFNFFVKGGMSFAMLALKKWEYCVWQRCPGFNYLHLYPVMS
jgi:hypothetical protein